MTKEELKQIHHLNNEIRMWQKELETLQCKSLALGQQLTGMPGGSRGISDKVGELACNIRDMEVVIQGKLTEIQFQRKKIMEYINTVPDSMMRQIIYYRNVSCMSWNQIANEIGGGNNSDSIRKSYDRFFMKK